jgi:hypothetical protein
MEQQKQTMSETKQLSKTAGKKHVPKVTPSQFVVKNFKVPREIVEKTPFGKGAKADVKPIGSNQYTIFPKYVYSQSSGENNSKADSVEETLGILTEPIEIKRGGLLKVDNNYRMTDDDCTAFWLPLQEDCGGEGSIDLKKMLEKIDEYYAEKIASNPNDFLVVKNGKTEEPVSNLSYIPLVKTAEAPDGAKDFVPWERTKVRIPFKEVDGKKEIDVKLVVPGDDGEPEKKVATSISELRKDFTYGCKAQFYLEIKTFWALKSTKKIPDPANPKKQVNIRDCGFKVTCKMINIIEKSKMSGGQKDYDWDDVLGDDEEGLAKQTKQPAKVVKETKKSNNSESDSNSDSESESDNNKKNAKSESESESEKELPKKEEKKETKKDKKGSKNKKAKSDSESDASDDDDPKDKKKGKGGKTKTK